jgi:glycine betaine/proline transport system permease protein
MWTFEQIKDFVVDAKGKIRVGDHGESATKFILEKFEWFFDGVKSVLNTVFDATKDGLLFIPPILLTFIIAGLTFWYKRSWRLTLGVLLGLLFIVNQGWWKESVQTLVLVGYSTAFSMVLGVPLGIWAAHSPRVWRVTQPILDLMQTMPTFVYLIPVLVLFGLGGASAVLVTIIFAMPAPVRMTHLGLTSIPTPMLEAGKSFGATASQLLWKVEIPAAMPSIMAGFTQCIMLCLSMVVIASLIGASSLGVPIIRALTQRDIGMGLEAGLAIVILAIILDRVLAQQAAKK